MNSALLSSLTSWRARVAGPGPTLEIEPLSNYLRTLSAEVVHRTLGSRIRQAEILEMYAVRLWTTIDLQAQRKHAVIPSVVALAGFVSELDGGRLYYGQVDAI